jgi:hypothetical protein
MSQLSNALGFKSLVAEVSDEATTTPLAPRRSSSGVSTHARRAAPPQVEDIESLSLDELRFRANQQLSEQQG